MIVIDRDEEFNQILKNQSIKTVYQPIVSLQNGDILGYEALMRGPDDSFIRSPLELIEVAKENNRIFELEMLSREKAIIGAKEMNKNMMLFLNIEPDIIKDVHYRMGYTKELLEMNGLSENNIVLEITERTAITDYEKYIDIIDNYKRQGYKIAIDDVGSGYSGLSRINNTKPEYIKIDMDLIRGINKDSFKQSLLSAMVKFASMTGMRSIAEGIETKEELETIIHLGVHYGQGYFIGRPNAKIIKKLDDIKDYILNTVYKRDKLSAYDIYTCKIGAIAETVKSKHAYDQCYTVKEYLYKKQCEGVAIVNEYSEPIGLMMKTDLDSKMSTQYGYSIYAKRQVLLLMDHYPIIVDYNTPIKRVSEIVTLRDVDKVYDNIVVTQNGKYYGIVSVRNLLQQITNIETNYARHLNPLTLLPGNKIINSVIAKNISINKKVAICYLDLDHFKIYNDTYGFDNGDKIIKMTARIIEKHVHNYFPFDSFIGHIGGDDFVFMMQDNLAFLNEALYDILDEFDHTVKQFFSQEDLIKGNICTYDECKNLKEFSITSASIGVYTGGLQEFQCVEKFGEYIGGIKKKAKELNGSSYVIYDENNQIINQYYNHQVKSTQG
ncbi:MAG: histidine kinase [Firmicutes bacterium HGW-Firmicutes-7]|nr:MAG: histidine kinase [Firmicutes bacterium HGW-Firmicutes-7]